MELFFAGFFVAKCYVVCAGKTLLSECGLLALILGEWGLSPPGLSGTLGKIYARNILLLLKWLKSPCLSRVHALPSSPDVREI